MLQIIVYSDHYRVGKPPIGPHPCSITRIMHTNRRLYQTNFIGYGGTAFFWLDPHRNKEYEDLLISWRHVVVLSSIFLFSLPRRVDLSIETRSYDLYWNSRSNSRHSVQSTGSGVPEALWPPRRARSSLWSALFLCTRGGWSINQIFISHTIRISLFSLFMSFAGICTSIVVHWGIDHPRHRYAHRKPQTAHQNIHFQSHFYHRSWQYFFFALNKHSRPSKSFYSRGILLGRREK